MAITSNMGSHLYCAFYTFLLVFLLANPVIADTVALSSPSDFTSATVFTEDFEDPLDGQYLEFSATSSNFRELASDASSGVTTSGEWGYVSSSVLTIKPLVETYEIGLYFGNDDFSLTVFSDVFLTAFVHNGSTTDEVVILPAVRKAPNGNDFVDQFIGIRTDRPIAKAVLEYSTTSLSLYIDDVSIGLAPVPIPAAIWLFTSGLFGLIGVARRRANA